MKEIESGALGAEPVNPVTGAKLRSMCTDSGIEKTTWIVNDHGR